MKSGMKLEVFDSITKGIDRCHKLQGKHDFVGFVPRYFFDKEFAVLVYGKPKGNIMKVTKEFLKGFTEMAVFWSHKKKKYDNLNEYFARLEKKK